jgi:hypothetical protein
MKDNFDLKKFLMESKALQNTNPLLAESEDKMRAKIREMILAELTPSDISEAKKDKEEEKVEDVDIESTEEVAPEEIPSEETPAAGGGIEDIAADMEGDEGELMNHLMSALKMAKGLNNEKLTTQIGNTLKFFVSEYIGGEE